MCVRVIIMCVGRSISLSRLDNDVVLITMNSNSINKCGSLNSFPVHSIIVNDNNHELSHDTTAAATLIIVSYRDYFNFGSVWGRNWRAFTVNDMQFIS